MSAGAFPPHVALVGSLPLAACEARLVSALQDCLGAQRGFWMQNAGVTRLRSAVVYDVGQLDGVTNKRLVALAGGVDRCVRPLLDPAAPGLAADLFDPGRWRGHLSLASHELVSRSDLRDEVENYVRRLAVAVPASFRPTPSPCTASLTPPGREPGGAQ